MKRDYKTWEECVNLREVKVTTYCVPALGFYVNIQTYLLMRTKCVCVRIVPSKAEARQRDTTQGSDPRQRGQ